MYIRYIYIYTHSACICLCSGCICCLCNTHNGFRSGEPAAKCGRRTIVEAADGRLHDNRHQYHNTISTHAHICNSYFNTLPVLWY